VSVKPHVSLVVTTYGGETAHTQHCLGAIRKWKRPEHELIVVVHDETPLLRELLVLCRRIGLIDELLFAVPGHGHVQGVNLGFAHARADLAANVCIDMRIGPGVVDDCVAMLRGDDRVGVVGWHYDWSRTFEGTLWRGGELKHALRKYDDSRVAGELDAEHVANMRAAPWFTGRVFGAIGTRRILCFNGSFFVARKALWDRLGGFDERRYPGHWADDFFTYAVLDQGLDVANLPAPYRCGGRPESFLALTDLEWQGRRDPYKGKDRIDWKPSRAIAGLGTAECAFLDMIERRLDQASAFTVIGDVPWTPRRGVRRDAPPADLVLAGAGADASALRSRLSPGGTLVVFGDPADAGEDRVGALTVAYSEQEERHAFARA
jgi:GT2 family glycosyltransferase